MCVAAGLFSTPITKIGAENKQTCLRRVDPQNFLNCPAWKHKVLALKYYSNSQAVIFVEDVNLRFEIIT